jgi:hypothetical protein
VGILCLNFGPLIELNTQTLYTVFGYVERKDLAMNRWIVVAIAMLCTACQNQTTPADVSTPVIVEVSVEAPMISTSTPDCLHADGVTFEVRRISDSSIGVQASGLQPGEIPSIAFYAVFPSGTSTRIESGHFVTGADEQGNFSLEEHLPRLPEGETRATWDVRFTHARGVECATITLP